ncbi:hypothetical protein HDU92_006342 [Lobulomyces angularis]|nr:hypothetical protein HDU92_006342 [Lobulomyces angularis]
MERLKVPKNINEKFVFEPLTENEKYEFLRFKEIEFCKKNHLDIYDKYMKMKSIGSEKASIYLAQLMVLYKFKNLVINKSIAQDRRDSLFLREKNGDSPKSKNKNKVSHKKTPSHDDATSLASKSLINNREICRFFLEGSCIEGFLCPNIHDKADIDEKTRNSDLQAENKIKELENISNLLQQKAEGYRLAEKEKSKYIPEDKLDEYTYKSETVKAIQPEKLVSTPSPILSYEKASTSKGKVKLEPYLNILEEPSKLPLFNNEGKHFDGQKDLIRGITFLIQKRIQRDKFLNQIQILKSEKVAHPSRAYKIDQEIHHLEIKSQDARDVYDREINSLPPKMIDSLTALFSDLFADFKKKVDGENENISLKLQEQEKTFTSSFKTVTENMTLFNERCFGESSDVASKRKVDLVVNEIKSTQEALKAENEKFKKLLESWKIKFNLENEKFDFLKKQNDQFKLEIKHYKEEQLKQEKKILQYEELALNLTKQFENVQDFFTKNIGNLEKRVDSVEKIKRPFVVLTDKVLTLEKLDKKRKSIEMFNTFEKNAEEKRMKINY